MQEQGGDEGPVLDMTNHPSYHNHNHNHNPPPLPLSPHPSPPPIYPTTTTRTHRQGRLPPHGPAVLPGAHGGVDEVVVRQLPERRAGLVGWLVGRLGRQGGGSVVGGRVGLCVCIVDVGGGSNCDEVNARVQSRQPIHSFPLSFNSQTPGTHSLTDTHKPAPVAPAAVGELVPLLRARQIAPGPVGPVDGAHVLAWIREVDWCGCGCGCGCGCVGVWVCVFGLLGLRGGGTSVRRVDRLLVG
jgi:hypothetical protein